ncbi:MAG TPA: RNA-binding S4 domain-containing protein [Firmicutes bacterium]|nr:RNA-binding S4 domain-containing protein [Bacillota bacterium]
MRQVIVESQEITLEALLKWSGITPTGGQAKRLIQSGMVEVNSIIETRRGRKLVPGDIVHIINTDETIQVVRR